MAAFGATISSSDALSRRVMPSWASPGGTSATRLLEQPRIHRRVDLHLGELHLQDWHAVLGDFVLEGNLDAVDVTVIGVEGLDLLAVGLVGDLGHLAGAGVDPETGGVPLGVGELDDVR